jgi:hypothetical protein
MFLNLIMGVFTLANSFIALFIVIYAFMFLKKTKSHRERRPWDYLFIASTIYLIYTILLMMLEIYNVTTIMDVNVFELSVFFQFIYTGLILLSFISQTDLIFKNDLIIIMKKLHPDEKQTIAHSIEFAKAEKAVLEKEQEKIKEEIGKVEEKLEAEIKMDVKKEIKQEIKDEQPKTAKILEEDPLALPIEEPKQQVLPSTPARKQKKVQKTSKASAKKAVKKAKKPAKKRK